MLERLINWFLKRELRGYFRGLRKSQQDSQTVLVTARELAREPKFWGYGADEIATAMLELVDEGFVDMYYQLVRLDGTKFDWLFFDPRDIPETVFDPREQGLVRTDPMDIDTAFMLNPYDGME